MNKLWLQGCSIGILFSTSIIGSYLYIFDQQKSITEEEMISRLKEKGFVTLSKHEYEELKTKEDVIEKETTPAPLPSPAPVPAAPPANEENQVITYTLTIKSGMSSSEIAETLENAKIIESASEFSTYLEEHELSTAVQIGTYSLTSEMSIKVIAKIITK